MEEPPNLEDAAHSRRTVRATELCLLGLNVAGALLLLIAERWIVKNATVTFWILVFLSVVSISLVAMAVAMIDDSFRHWRYRFSLRTLMSVLLATGTCISVLIALPGIPLKVLSVVGVVSVLVVCAMGIASFRPERGDASDDDEEQADSQE